MQDFRRGMFAPNVERRAEKPRASRGKGTDGPRMVSPRKILALGMAIWLTAPAGALQQDDPHARIRTTVELVVVPVTVKDSSGKRSEEHTSELQSPMYLVCRLLLEKKNRRDNMDWT